MPIAMMFRIKILLYLIPLIFFKITICVASIDSTALVKQYMRQYKLLEQFNDENEKKGRPDLNNYIIDLDPNWLDEKPHRIYTKSYYETLGQRLKDFNTLRTDNLRVYVMVMNSFRGHLKKTVKLDALPSEIGNFNKYVEVSNKEYKKFISEVRTLPKDISKALEEKGYENRVIYFCGIIELYNTPKKRSAYLYTSLAAEGPVLETKRYDLAKRLHLNWQTENKDTPPELLEPIADKIFKGVHNLLDAVEMVIDKGLTSDQRDPRCEMASLEQAIPFTKTTKEIDFGHKVSACAALVKAPTPQQQLGSRYVIVENPDHFSKEIFFHEELPDKVKLVSENGFSDYKLYVVYKEINFAMPPNEWAQFAHDVYTQSNLSGNDILITVPYYTTTCTFLNGYGGETTQKDKLMMPAAYADGNADMVAAINAAFPSLALETSTKYVQKRWQETFEQAFSKIPKYYEIYPHRIHWNGDVEFHDKKRFGPIVGLSDLVAIRLEEDSRYNKYVELEDSKASCYSTGEDQDLTYKYKCLDDIDQEITDLSHTPEDFQLWKKNSNLIQSKLTQTLATEYVTWISARKLRGILSSFAAPGGSNFYGKHNYVKEDDIMGVIDRVSLVASVVQLDWIFDGAGAIYAFSQDRKLEGGIYLTALALPVGAAVLKKLRKGEGYLLKSASGEYLFVSSEIGSAIVRGEKTGNNVSDVMRAILHKPEALAAVSKYGDNLAFIKSFENDLLNADGTTLKAFNDDHVLVDEFHTFQTEGKGDLKAFMEAKSLSPADDITLLDFNDLPGINVASLGKDEAITTAVARIKPEAGYFDVVVHGSADRFWVLHNGKWEGVTHRSLIRYLEKNQAFKEAQGIRLISCEAGTKELAQNFANKAGKKARAVSGVKVGVDESGNIVSLSGKPGHWAEFEHGNWTGSFENPGNAGGEIRIANEGDNIVPLGIFDDLKSVKLREAFEGDNVVKIYLDEGGTYLGSCTLHDDGLMTLDIDVKLGPNKERVADGEAVFNLMLTKLAEKNSNKPMKGIIGMWVDNPELNTNLIKLNKLIVEQVNKKLITLEEAALQTFTGRMASEKKFNYVALYGPRNYDGTFKTAIVHFTNDPQIIKQLKTERLDLAINTFKAGTSSDNFLINVMNDAQHYNSTDELAEVFQAIKPDPSKFIGASGKDYQTVFRNLITDDASLYFDATKRLNYEVKIKDGKWFVNGNMLEDGEKYIFVMGKDGTLYAGKDIPGQIHHSYFLGGQNVTLAGTVKFENSQRIIKIINESGHYEPGGSALWIGILDFLREMAYRGTDIKSITYLKLH